MSKPRFVECAVAGEADYIVSGDKRLLDLDEYSGIKILKPTKLLDLIKRRKLS